MVEVSITKKLSLAGAMWQVANTVSTESESLFKNILSSAMKQVCLPLKHQFSQEQCFEPK